MAHILIVDDDPAIGRMLTLVLGCDAHHVVAVTSADEALATLGAGQFDKVLSEFIVGSRMSGLELCFEVHRQWPQVRFVLGTRVPGLDGGLARAYSVDAILPKPYRRADLRRALGGYSGGVRLPKVATQLPVC